MIVKVEKVGNVFQAVDSSGDVYTSDSLDIKTMEDAFNDNFALKQKIYDDGTEIWLKVPFDSFVADDSLKEQQMFTKLIEDSVNLRPDRLIVSDLKWKHFVRSVYRGKNILVTGYSGCGKTEFAISVAEALNRPYEVFHMGSTAGDPRPLLLGNLTADPETGTKFSVSRFIEMIQTPNAVIILEELSRSHPDAWNLLMPVLDKRQGYIRLDESDDKSNIYVAEGVSFIANANIGNEFTATRTMDWALLDRFTHIEMDLLTKEEEIKLLSMIYPMVDSELIENVANVVDHTRQSVKDDDSEISSIISTRKSIEIVGLINDGFTFNESFEAEAYSQYLNDGPDSERAELMGYVQRFDNGKQTNSLGGSNLFSSKDMNNYRNKMN